MADDIVKTDFGAIFRSGSHRGLGAPYIADQLWQIEAVRTVDTGLVIALVISVLILVVLAYLQFSGGGWWTWPVTEYASRRDLFRRRHRSAG